MSVLFFLKEECGLLLILYKNLRPKKGLRSDWTKTKSMLQWMALVIWSGHQMVLLRPGIWSVQLITSTFTNLFWRMKKHSENLHRKKGQVRQWYSIGQLTKFLMRSVCTTSFSLRITQRSFRRYLNLGRYPLILPYIFIIPLPLSLQMRHMDVKTGL